MVQIQRQFGKESAHQRREGCGGPHFIFRARYKKLTELVLIMFDEMQLMHLYLVEIHLLGLFKKLQVKKKSKWQENTHCLQTRKCLV